MLILANKCDLSCACSVDEVIAAWDLTAITDRTWTVRPCSAKSGTNLLESFDWLASVITQQRDEKAQRS